MGKTITIISLVLVFSLSCKQPPRNELSSYKALTQTLRKVNRYFANHNEFLLNSLDNKLTDSQTSMKATKWYPRAQFVQHVSSELLTFIQSLEHVLTQTPEIDQENTQFVKDLLYEKKMVDTLKTKLSQFRLQLRSIDPEITVNFENDLNDSQDKEIQEYLASIFKDASVVKAISIFVKLQADVLLLENRILAFCNNKVPEIDRSEYRI